MAALQECTSEPSNLFQNLNSFKHTHRRTGSSMTAASIKAVAMNGNIVENLLVNLGIRKSGDKNTKKKNFCTLIGMYNFYQIFIFSNT